MCSPDQESLKRRFPAPPLATDHGTETTGESRLSCTAAVGGRHVATGGGPLVVVLASDMLQKSVYQGSEAPPPPLPLRADVPADILGCVFHLLPCIADRASVQSVCRHWRAAARNQPLTAPLPVLVLPCFRLSCLTSDGWLTGARRAPLSTEVAGNDAWIVGSCDDWLMTARSTGHGMETAECCLVNAFSSEVVPLPRMQSNSKSSSAHSSEQYFEASLLHGALSASPSSMSKYIVAVFTYCGCGPACGLALWQPGMTSWYLCLSSQINSLSYDLAFYQGKLYVVRTYTPDIFAFEVKEDEHRVSLSCPEHYKIGPLIPPKTTGSRRRRCNLVVWRGKLLLFIRNFSCADLSNYNIANVEVFALDFKTSPCGVTQIHNFDGDCIFVQESGCRPFSPSLLVGVQGDLIYYASRSLHTCTT